MYNNHRGVARAAITAALTLSMSVGSMPLAAFADEASNDAAQSQLTATAEESAKEEAPQAEEKSQEASAPSTLSAAEEEEGEQSDSEEGNDAENPENDGESQDGEETSGDDNKQDDGVTQGEEVTSTESGDATTDSGDVKHGTWGTCAYDLSADGTLTVHPGELERSTPSGVDMSVVKRVVFVEEGGRKAIARQDSGTSSSLPYFSGMKALESVDLSGLDVSHVTNMNTWFYGCSALKSVDLSGLDTSSVESMTSMFSHCSALTSVNLSNLDIKNVTNMQQMFYQCPALISVKLDGLNTSKVQDFSGMFYECTSLKELDVSKLDVSSATDISAMFYYCKALEIIDVSRWNVTNVKQFTNVFCGCDSVKVLDLSGWDTSSVETGSKAVDLFKFDGHPSLELIKVSDRISFSIFPLYGLSGQEVIDRYGDDVRPSWYYWYSWNDGVWYTYSQIQNRANIADTYSKYKPGDVVQRTIATNVITNQGAPTITWNNAADVAPSLLTSDELARFNAGEDASVWLEVSVVPTNDADRNDNGLALNGAGFTKNATYVDMYTITLWKKVGNDPATNITSISSPLNLSLEVPGERRNDNPAISRLFQLFNLRGVSEPSLSASVPADTDTSNLINKVAETTNNSIGFQVSDPTSFYFLTYSDSEASNSGSSQEEEQSTTTTTRTTSTRATSSPVSSTRTATTGSTTKSSTATPKTADASIGGFAATAASGFAALLYGLRRKKRDE